MNQSNDMLCMFAAQVTEDESGDGYVLEVPANEVEYGSLNEGDTVQVMLTEQGSTGAGGGNRNDTYNDSTQNQTPPVDENDVLEEMEIVSLGDQGDGITRTEEGYVIVVPNSSVGDVLDVKITQVNENYAKADIEREHRRATRP